jgi:hypothetical protein
MGPVVDQLAHGVLLMPSEGRIHPFADMVPAVSYGSKGDRNLIQIKHPGTCAAGEKNEPERRNRNPSNAQSIDFSRLNT